LLSKALLCLALNIFFEARGEPIAGMEAVAQVTLNRAHHNESKVCKVVFEKGQFTWTAHVKRKSKSPMEIAKNIPKHNKSWGIALEIAQRALEGRLVNRVGNATHFYNPKKCKPSWLKNVKTVAVIGNHVFAVLIKKSFEQKVIKLKDEGNGTHRSPREHVRRGHVRRYADGKKIWIQSMVVNPGNGGKVTKDYIFK